MGNYVISLGFVKDTKATRVSRKCVSSNDLILRLNNVLLKSIVSSINNLLCFADMIIQANTLWQTLLSVQTHRYIIYIFLPFIVTFFIAQETH